MGTLERAKADKGLSADDVRDLAAIAGTEVAKRAKKATAFASIQKRHEDHRAFLDKQAVETSISVSLASFAEATSDGQSQRAELDALGFYSKALEAAKAWKQKRGTPEQVLQHLLKAGAGVKNELEALGLTTFLEGKKSVTRDEVVSYLRDNRVEVREAEYVQANAPGDHGPAAGYTRWRQHSLARDDNNPSYRETVLHLPASPDAKLRVVPHPSGSGFALQTADGGYSQTERGTVMRWTERQHADRAASEGAYETKDFRSGHWSEPNVIGNLMTSLNKLGDKTTFALSQIQSDWAQEILKRSRDAVAQELFDPSKPEVEDRIQALLQREEDAGKARDAFLLGEPLAWLRSTGEIASDVEVSAADVGRTLAHIERDVRSSAIRNGETAAAQEQFDRVRAFLDDPRNTAPFQIIEQIQLLRARTKRFRDLPNNLKSEVSAAISQARQRGELPAGARDEKKIAELRKRLEEAKSLARSLKTPPDYQYDDTKADDLLRLFVLTFGEERPRLVSALQNELGRPYYTRGTADRAAVNAALTEALSRVQSGARLPAEDRMEAMNEVNRLSAELSTAETATPPHPFVNTTDQWLTTTLRQVIRQAIAANADSISIPSGATVLGYNQQGSEEGNEEFYDKIVPIAQKVVLDEIVRDAYASDMHGLGTRYADLNDKQKQAVNTAIKKDDAFVKPTKVATVQSPVDGRELGKGFTVFPITDKVREQVQRGSLALFALSSQRSRLGPEERTGSYSRIFASRANEFAQALQEEFTRMVGASGSVSLVDRLVNNGVASDEVVSDPRSSRQLGLGNQWLLSVALSPGETTAKIKGFHGVAAHMMRRYGGKDSLYTAREWRDLVSLARKSGMQKELESVFVTVDGRSMSAWEAYKWLYAGKVASDGRSMTQEYLDQELVGRLAERYYEDMLVGADGRPERTRTYGAKIDALLDRLAEFIAAVRRALNRIGITRFDELIEPVARRAEMASELGAYETLDKVRSGEIASRVKEAPKLEIPKYDPNTYFPATPSPDQVHLSSEEGQEALGLFPAIRAFHGSPYDFDRFDITRIGTGEGAQAYGHGLYFAQSEGVARSYREKLTDQTNLLRPDGTTWDPSELEHLNVRVAARRSGGDLDAVLARARGLRADPDMSAAMQEMLDRDIAKLTALKDSGGVSPNPGRLYEVSLDVEPEQLLDWDKPLGEQSEAVRKALSSTQYFDMEAAAHRRVYGEDITVQRILEVLPAAATAGPDAVSRILREAGIPGIRYKDAGSRGAEGGTSNFVIFDDSLVKIVAKDGKPVASEERADVLQQMHQEQEGGSSTSLASFSSFNPISAISDRIWALYVNWAQPADRAIGPPPLPGERPYSEQLGGMRGIRRNITDAAWRRMGEAQSDLKEVKAVEREIQATVQRQLGVVATTPEALKERIKRLDPASPLMLTLTRLAKNWDYATRARELIESVIAESRTAKRNVDVGAPANQNRSSPIPALQAQFDAEFEAMRLEREQPDLQVIEGGAPTTLAAFSERPAPETRPFSGFEGGTVTEKVKETGERLRTYNAGGSNFIVSEQPDGSWELTFFRADDASRLPEIVAAIEQDIGKPISPRGWLSPQGYQYWLQVAPDRVKFHVNAGEMFGGMWASPRAVEFAEAVMAEAAASSDASTRLTEASSHLSRLKSSIPQEAFTEARREERFSMESAPPLDMSPEARKARAEEMGFDTSRVWYHGTKAGGFDAFDLSMGGRATDARSARMAIFFASKPSIAGTYASAGKHPKLVQARLDAEEKFADLERRAEAADAELDQLFERRESMPEADYVAAWNAVLATKPELNDIFAARYAAIAARSAADRSGGIGGPLDDGAIVPVYTRIRNPFIDDREGKVWHEGRPFSEVLEEAQAAGHDAVIFRNVYDAWIMYGGEEYTGDILAVFDPANIRSTQAAFDPSQEGSPVLLASFVGGPPGTPPSGGPQLPTTPASQGDIRGLIDIIADLKSALRMTTTQGLYGMSVRDRAGGRSWSFRPQSSVRSQYDANAGVARIRVATDIDAIAREGGRHIEQVFGAPMQAFLQTHAEELAVPPAPDNQLPAIAPTGFSGIDLDADTQRALVDAASYTRQWQALTTAGAAQATRYDVAAQAAIARSTLQRRLGRTIADHLVSDLVSQSGQPAADYVRERYSATGTPTPRVAPTPTAADISTGFASFFQRYITDPDAVKRDMPGVYVGFEAFLDANDPAMLEGIERVQLTTLSEDYKAYREATALERLKADTVSHADQRMVTRLKEWFRRNRRDTVAGTVGAMGSEVIDGVESLSSVVYEGAVDETHPFYLVTRKLLEQADTNKVIDPQGRAISLAVHENPAKLIRSVGDAFKTGLRWIQDGMPNYRHGGAGFEVVAPSGRTLGIRPDMASAQALAATSTEQTTIVPLVGRRSPPLRDALQLAMGNNWNYQTYENLGAYLIARRAIEEWARYQRGELERRPIKIYATGQPADEIAALTNIIREFEQANPNFSAAAQVVYEFLWQQAIHDFQAGRLTQAELDYRATRKHFYVPFSRDMTDLLAQRGFGGRTTTFTKDKRFQGSDRSILNPIEAIIDQTFHRAAATHMNEVVGSLARLADRVGQNGGEIAERVTKTELIEANNTGFRELQAYIEGLGYDAHDAREMVRRVEADFGDTHLLVTQDPTNLGPKRPILLTLYENGERQYVRVNDPEWAQHIYSSVNGIGRELTSLFIDSVAAPAALLRFGVTTSPAFVLPNIIRDMWSSWILTGGVNPRTWPIVTQIRGLYHELRQTEEAELYQEVAGLMGGQNVAALSKVRDKADVMALKDKGLQLKPVSLTIGTAVGAGIGFTLGGPGGALMGAFAGAGLHRGVGKGKFTETMSYFSDMSETATRMGVFTEAYRAALAYNPDLTPYQAAQEAAFVARDLIDFGRRGSKMLAAARLVPFMNAAIQGLDKAQRTLLARSDRGNAFSTTKLIGHMAAGAGAGFLVAGPVGGAVGTFAGPALASNLAARSAAARALLSPFTRKDMGIRMSRDEERAMGQSAKSWANLLVYTLTLVAAGSLYHWLTDDDDEYNRIPPRFRFRNQPMKINGQWYMFPKAFEWAIPSNIIEAAIESQFAGDPRFWERVREGLFDNLAPPGVPQAFRIWGDVRSNYDSFRQRPIVADYIRTDAPELQFNAYASQLAIALSRAVNSRPWARSTVETAGSTIFGTSFELTPAIIDYVLRTGGGYWGADIQRFSNVTTVGGSRITDFPIIGAIGRRFTFDPNRVSDAMTRYWELLGREHFGFRRAAQSYQRYNEMYGPQAANQHLATLEDPEQQAYALLEASGSRLDRQRHPLTRVQRIVRATMDMERDLTLERLADTSVTSSPTPIRLSPAKRDEVRDALARIRAIEAHNAMVTLQHRQFAGRQILDMQPALDILAAASPEAFREYELRLQRARVVAFSEVQGWPAERDRLLQEWREAMDQEAALIRPGGRGRRPVRLPLGTSRELEAQP